MGSSRELSKLGQKVEGVQIVEGYTGRMPSGFLKFLIIAMVVTARERLPPAESPVRMTFLKSIPNNLFILRMSQV